MLNQGQAKSRSDAVQTHLFSDVDLVVFDLDGVIADSEIISLDSLRQALSAFDIELTQEEVRKKFLGASLATITRVVEQMSPLGKADGFASLWEDQLFERFYAELQPVPEIEELLDRLDEQGIDYCIASSGTFERIDVALNAIELRHRFRQIFSAQLVSRGKPSPDLFLHAAQKFGVQPDRCLVVEDSPYGIQAAKSAGMRVLGFTGGAHIQNQRSDHAKLLLDLGADDVVASHDKLFP